MADGRGHTLTPTASQTVGPFFHLGLDWLFSSAVADPDAPGTHLTVRGRVLDGERKPVSDALVELWQADPEGAYAVPGRAPSPGFRGYARVPTDELGAFEFSTVKPGRVAAPGGGLQAPHALVHVFMRGLLRPLVTRLYFADERANADDPVLAAVPASRRETLLAVPRPWASDVFEWNIVLQGPGETVFFDG
ncbi:MAG TPA: protocatechuate 3,4-dioxygenase subunit alpha [Polyangiaceae bacterium]|nr:protocatechuate 3,4-dioxygenase subunit alpha [Polyangiaceae bacterium]